MAIYGPGRPIKYNPGTGSGVKPPAKPGEYRIRNGLGILIYIGETNDLRRRMWEHIRSGKLKAGILGHTFEYQIADGRSSSRTRRVHEREKIRQHKPRGNKSGGGEGRIARR